MLKSCGEAASQSKNGRQIASACCWSSPWNTIAIARTLPGRKAICSPQCGLSSRLAVEADDLADQPAERGVRGRLDRHEHGAEELRQIVRPQREPGHDAEAAATAALDRPEQVRIRAGVGDPHRAVGGDDLGFQQARRGHAVGLREASEAAALDQAGDAHGQAAAALDVAARLAS